MIPELAYQANGYLKIRTRRGEKAYLAMVICSGETRFSRGVFRTASAADAYGDRLVARVRRMVVSGQVTGGQVTGGRVTGGRVTDPLLQENREEVAA